ncbi:MAG: tetratricopeptide repeat protein [Terriglobia bacterium]|jgi:tetratricopeptide (TPR) repeat protein
MEALRKGDYGAAILALEKLTTMAPGVAELQANLGVAYYSAGRPQDAVAPLRKALKLKPSLTSAHYFLGISLAESGNCKAAMPFLETDYPRLNDQRLRRIVGLDGARCARALDEPYRAINYLQRLNRDFPDDPEVLYLTTDVFSDLSTRASQQLLHVAPGSYQAHRLYAEALEVQGKTADAIAEYRKVLTMDPRLPGIHYRLGRLMLAGEPDSATLDAAREEFEEELRINPTDADSEYELGEMARQARKWNEAIEHFRRAVKIDPHFPQALIGLGKSLVSAGRAAEAVVPLENAVQLAPADAVAHYQLSFAYLRVGREEDAKKQLALYREAHDQHERVNQAIRLGIVGDISQPQTAEPPE